ncbi:MAG: penicillin-binding protein 1C [Chloroherpetonaceae bacterium]|nr:penicillin-binding protein 1C [Chloroherpetonaceae bacterium]
MRSKLLRTLKISLWATLIFDGWLIIWLFTPLLPQERKPFLATSLKIYDRNGMLLREVLSREGGVSERVQLNAIPDKLQQALIIAEDKNFYSHRGIDWLATLRALKQNLLSGEVISGASTISQQLARLRLGIGRGILEKGVVMLYAFRLEMHLSKAEILEDYLNRVPFGNQAIGISAASDLYFSKKPSALTLAESSLLVSILPMPSSTNPFRNQEAALKRRNQLLYRLKEENLISKNQLEESVQEPLEVEGKKKCFQAPHFVEYLLQAFSDSLESVSEIETTLDLALQNDLHIYLRDHLERLKKKQVTNGALIVLDNHQGEVLAFIGSRDYFDESISGEYSVITANRQPGSALKPFVYAIGIEEGIHASTILADLPQLFASSKFQVGENLYRNESFIPENFDRKYHGPIRLRQALACSYNIPAVLMNEKIGVANFYHFLKRAGITTLNESPEHYGVGLALGNSEVRLMDLAEAYMIFQNRGIRKRLSFLRKSKSSGSDSPTALSMPNSEEAILSPQAAFIISDILSDNSARRPAFGANSPLNLPFASLAKTGTTKDFRDNWAFGSTADFTVGVWVGNSNGMPMKTLSGIDGAGPILKDILMHLYKKQPNLPGFQISRFTVPPKIVTKEICTVSGDLANIHCPTTMNEFFLRNCVPQTECTQHRLLEIDTRNGFLAHHETPNIYKASKVFEDYPPQFQQWAKEQGKQLPPETYSTLREKKLNNPEPSKRVASYQNETATLELNDNETTQYKIMYPKPDMIFAIDKHLRAEYQRINISTIEKKGARFFWKLNGQPLSPNGIKDSLASKSEIDSTFWASSISWQLEKGMHTLELFEMNMKSKRQFKKIDEVRFTVVE